MTGVNQPALFACLWDPGSRDPSQRGGFSLHLKFLEFLWHTWLVVSTALLLMCTEGCESKDKTKTPSQNPKLHPEPQRAAPEHRGCARPGQALAPSTACPQHGQELPSLLCPKPCSSCCCSSCCCTQQGHAKQGKALKWLFLPNLLLPSGVTVTTLCAAQDH